jgi:hypothetical protein
MLDASVVEAIAELLPQSMKDGTSHHVTANGAASGYPRKCLAK